MNTVTDSAENQNLNQDLIQVKQILFALNGTFKKLSLYFGNHTIFQDALNQLKKLLDDYLGTHAELRFDIQRDAVFYGEEKVHDEKLEPNELFFILFRDGVLWLSFQSGLELWELDTFYKIVHKHMTLDDTAEDDVVTSLWEFNLQGIMYEAADLDLGAMDVLEDPDFRYSLCPDEGPSDSDPSWSSAEDHEFANKYKHLMGSDEIWNLTGDEREALRKMVAEDEKLDGTDSVIDVLLYILRRLDQPNKDIDELLDTLTQELREALQNGRFAYFHQVMQKLARYQKDMQAAGHWSSPYLQRFFESLAQPSFLNMLIDVSSQVENCEPQERAELTSALLLLDPSAVRALASLLMEIKTTKTYELLMTTIGTMAGRDFRLLDQMLTSDAPELVRRLVHILGHLKDPASRQALSRMIAHSAAPVRREALKAILARDNCSLREVFKLVDDPDEGVRALLLNHLGRERNPHAEDLLLDYLGNGQLGYKIGELIPLYQALGRCGSDRSIAFLEKKLFRWPRLGILRPVRNPHRQAALVALRALHTPAASKLINRQARGFFGNILRRP